MGKEAKQGFPHEVGCQCCLDAHRCNECGAQTTMFTGRCTNGRCTSCHNTVCGHGDAHAPYRAVAEAA